MYVCYQNIVNMLSLSCCNLFRYNHGYALIMLREKYNIGLQLGLYDSSAVLTERRRAWTTDTAVYSISVYHYPEHSK